MRATDRIIFTLSGTFTNNASGQFIVGNDNNTSDVANVGTLSNSGYVYIGTGATLNLTNQASGITDVVSGSRLQVAGTFKAGANSALAHLNSIEGELDLGERSEHHRYAGFGHADGEQQRHPGRGGSSLGRPYHLDHLWQSEQLRRR